MDKRIFWYSVIASIIASIGFSWLLEPISRWLWNAASDSALSWLTSLQDAAFLNAALGKRDWATVKIFFFFSTFLWAAFLGALIGAYLAHRRAKSPDGTLARFRKSAQHRRVGIAVLVLWITLGLYQWAQMCFLFYVDLQLNASFSQRLDALGPYVDLMDEKRLRSAWALMKSHADYEKINIRLDELASRAGVTLPPPLYR